MNHLNDTTNIFWNSLTCFLVILNKLGKDITILFIKINIKKQD